MRSESLTDALTPPPEAAVGKNEGMDESEGGEVGQGEEGDAEKGVGGAIPSAKTELSLEDDMLLGNEEEVFTTPARLLAAVQLAIKEAKKAGDNLADIEELESLQSDVAARCDFL